MEKEKQKTEFEKAWEEVEQALDRYFETKKKYFNFLLK